MDVNRLALPLPDMLDKAVQAHRWTYQGEDPLRFELHPEVVRALLRHPRASQFMDFRRIQYGEHAAFGVPIRLDTQARRPRLITCRNQVEYL